MDRHTSFQILLLPGKTVEQELQQVLLARKVTAKNHNCDSFTCIRISFRFNSVGCDFWSVCFSIFILTFVSAAQNLRVTSILLWISWIFCDFVFDKWCLKNCYVLHLCVFFPLANLMSYNLVISPKIYSHGNRYPPTHAHQKPRTRRCAAALQLAEPHKAQQSCDAIVTKQHYMTRQRIYPVTKCDYMD